MKLLVILLCLLSERYLVHKISLNRFKWFNDYVALVTNKVDKVDFFKNPWVMLAVFVLPILFVAWLALAVLGHLLFGLVGFVIQLAIFYYCLGPQNPFYPVTESDESKDDDALVAKYFFTINHRLFAVILWYVLLGPIAVLAYRLLYLSKDQEVTHTVASYITDALDWISARITSLIYLLVGNFQRGFQKYTELFFAGVDKNEELLGSVGLLALRTDEQDSTSLPAAQVLAEQALVVTLVFLALFTLVAWL